jgi:hypothetical protein
MMEDVWTTKGLIPAADLAYSTGEVDNDNEHTTWEEWRDHTGEIVKRAVHVRLKRGVESTMLIGDIG